MLRNPLVPALLWTLVAVPSGAAGVLVKDLALSQTSTVAPSRNQNSCPVTQPNGHTPPGQRSFPSHHGNGALWTHLYPDGTVVFEPGGSGFVLEDGSLQMKFGWWRAVPGELRIEGRRLDAPAPPLRAYIPRGYNKSFQATGLIFPTPGCWEVTGRVGEASLSFVTRVVKIGDGPARGPRPEPPPN